MSGQDIALFKAIGAKLDYLSQRHKVIAENIANADTPGYRPRDLEWYQVYAALRHAIIMSRIHDRAVRFGEQPGWPDNPDDVVPHRATLEAMMDGTFWG